jgi:hypothetical protein
MAHIHDIRWCGPHEFEQLDPPMDGAVKWYCLKAIEEVDGRSGAELVGCSPGRR